MSANNQQPKALDKHVQSHPPQWTKLDELPQDTCHYGFLGINHLPRF